ncbi:LemA family protein [Mumia sp. DW29H23]|uniref:LemA family protein n=1 Tax=Mumia sp. DW29H23 TaxID=3421241 RepID=UPI003D69CC7C
MHWIIVAVVVVLIAVLAAVGFNKLRAADVRADEALGGIDVQLTRRADLVPNLVSTVKGYAEHERSVFDEVTAARTAAASAARDGSVEQKSAADARLDKALVDVLAVAEAYPDLKASTNFQQLQTELAETEDQLAFARQYYNDAAARLNTLVRTLPWLFFTGVAGVGQRAFYAAPSSQTAPPTVQF